MSKPKIKLLKWEEDNGRLISTSTDDLGIAFEIRKNDVYALIAYVLDSKKNAYMEAGRSFSTSIENAQQTANICIRNIIINQNQ